MNNDMLTFLATAEEIIEKCKMIARLPHSKLSGYTFDCLKIEDTGEVVASFYIYGRGEYDYETMDVTQEIVNEPIEYFEKKYLDAHIALEEKKLNDKKVYDEQVRNQDYQKFLALKARFEPDNEEK